MNTLVTGGAGFIGSHLVELLIKNGHQVTVIDNLSRGKLEYLHPKAKFIQADIRDRNISKYFQKIDWVFHLAAIASTPPTIKDPWLTNDININGTLNLLLAAQKTKVKRFINSSSNVVYSPETPYYVSKTAAENYTSIFSSLYNLSTISLRYSNVYGSLRANPENCIMAMRNSWLTNNFINVNGDGKQSRDFTHVEEIAKANLLAAKSSYQGVIDICTGKNTTINTIAKIFNCPIKYLPDRPGDIKHIYQDPKPAKKILNFTAFKLLKNNLRLYTEK